MIPPAGPQVAIFGMVKRPAIYELKGSSTLKEVLDDAGGATVAAALDHITIDRIDPNKQRETVTLASKPSDTAQSRSLAQIAAFEVKDGDRIHVAADLALQRARNLCGGPRRAAGQVSVSETECS